jgi:hypothetical protein
MAPKKVVRKEKGAKDDGSRWAVVDPVTQRPLYLRTEEGLKRPDADRLAAGLLTRAEVICVRDPASN